MCSLELFIFNKQDTSIQNFSKQLDTEGIWEKKNFCTISLKLSDKLPLILITILSSAWWKIETTYILHHHQNWKSSLCKTDQIKSIVELNIAIKTKHTLYWQPIQDWPHCCKWMTSSTCLLIRLNAPLSNFSPIHQWPPPTMKIVQSGHSMIQSVWLIFNKYQHRCVFLKELSS